ncbi:serine/threonine-protein kinase [Kordiimonas aestuarii]|uniref:serine/threonine-protein kinase n=1 Tax=Kordiimonas aestuarii TaxID=1005925 RepID=UPI0021D171DF|nr:serine/threonine-protein kinase [Kordiimonas aestuarii]
MPTQNIERYNLLYTVGAGSHGTVLCAFDTVLQRKVALKELTSPAGTDTLADDDWQEALALARINHPNIVTIHEVFRDQGTAYLVTEFVEGQSLGARLAEDEVDFTQAVTIALKLADGLRGVHEQGLVHADIKPDNIMIRDDGEPVLVDFGIARAAPTADDMRTVMEDEPSSLGGVAGTLAYMAPEVIRGDPPTARSDIFSLGVVIYEMLSGTKAFKQKTEAGTIYAVLADRPPSLTKVRRETPSAFADLVSSMMARDATERPASMQDVYRALYKWSPEGIRQRQSRQRLTYLGVAATFLIMLVGLWRLDILTPPKTISGLMATGLEGLKSSASEEQVDITIEAFRHVLLRAPDNAGAKSGLSLGLTRKYVFGEKSAALLEQARTLAESAVELDNQLALSHVALARALEFEGKDEASEQAYVRALELDPSNFFAFRNYGRLLIKRNDLAEAEQKLKAAIAYYPEESTLYDLLGRVYFRKQEYGPSREAFKASLSMEPDNVYAHASLSATYYMEGDTAGAIAALQAGLQVRRAAVLYSNLGTYYFALGQYPQSAQAFERALEMTGGGADYRLWANLADAYRAVPGQEKKAVGAYRQALDHMAPLLAVARPRPDLLSRAALYHAKADEGADARKRLSEALELDRDDATLLFRASVTSEILGERTEAIRFVRGALDQGFPLSVIRAEPDLINLRQDREFLDIILSHNITPGD